MENKTFEEKRTFLETNLNFPFLRLTDFDKKTGGRIFFTPKIDIFVPNNKKKNIEYVIRKT